MDRDEALKLLRGGAEGVKRWNAWRAGVGLKMVPSLGAADLRDTDLGAANLWAVNLRCARLNRARLAGARLDDGALHEAEFIDADLRNVDLSDANLTEAFLINSDLRGADLTGAKLNGTDLSGAKLSGAIFAFTCIACDLSEASGLNSTRHHGPSYVDVNSILRFKGDLPEEFLRGCGLREEEIAYFRSQVGQPVRFHSCFISYSTADEAFATRLHNDFQAAGIRCWKWDHDARTGRSLWGEIDQAIRLHDKVVLIASESSLKSPAVNREIERAICEEDRRMRRKEAGEFDRDVNVLFPVRVDDYIFKGWEHERKVDVTKKVVADARGWDKDDTIYRTVLDRLIRDLKPESA